MMSIFSSFMSLALEKANDASLLGEVPVAALLVHKDSGDIISILHNKMQENNNPIFHAEMLVIQEACSLLNIKYLEEYDLYVTLEPCLMCAGAISHARVGRLFYAASDIKFGAVENGVMAYHGNKCGYKPEVYPGIMKQESEKLLREFFHKLR